MKFYDKIKKLQEAVERPAGVPAEMMNPEKAADVEAGRVETMAAFPEDPTALDYYHMLFNKNYAKCIERLCHYTNTPPERLRAQPLMRTVVGALQTIQQLERNHRADLEKLALQCVLELGAEKDANGNLIGGEFQIVREYLEDHKIIFDVKLDYGQLQNAVRGVQDQLNEDERKEKVDNKEQLTDSEKAEIKLFMDMAGQEEIKIRKALGDALMQGDALDKMYLFNIVSEKLNDISPELVNLYGVASSIVQILYYIQPKGIEDMAAQGQGAMGSEEVQDAGNGVYRIKARGLIFPFLVHEIVKGINHYFNYTHETSEEKRTLSDETTDINYGQALIKAITTLIPADKMKYRLTIQNRLLKGEAGGGTSIEDVKKVLKGGPEARRIINDMISEIEGEHGETEEEEDDTWQDTE